MERNDNAAVEEKNELENEESKVEAAASTEASALDEIDDIDFVLGEIEDKIAPLALA